MGPSVARGLIRAFFGVGVTHGSIDDYTGETVDNPDGSPACKNHGSLDLVPQRRCGRVTCAASERPASVDALDLMPTIDLIRLRCVNPDAQRRFYCESLGMTAFDDGSVGYGGEDARLQFDPAERPYASSPSDLYWKIALSVPNIELACQQLASRGVEVGPPRQFEQVAYLAHFKDPEGFTVELLDHWFKGEREDQRVEAATFGGGAHLNLLTLRAVDMAAVDQGCKAWGMRLLALVPVASRGFTLYFFAFSDEALPSADVSAVENRTWVYRRPYTVLEIQHSDQATEVRRPQADEAGYAGATLSGVETTETDDGLLLSARRDPARPTPVR